MSVDIEERLSRLERNQSRLIDQVKSVSAIVNNHTDAIKRVAADLANATARAAKNPFGLFG